MALVKVELDVDETVEGLAKLNSEVIFLAIVVGGYTTVDDESARSDTDPGCSCYGQGRSS